MNISEFTQLLFSNQPLPPFSYFMQLDLNSNYEQILGNMLIQGSLTIYNKQLCDLTASEISHLREYLLSIGWDADYGMVNLNKEVLDYHPNGEPYIFNLKINNWQVTFKAADPALRPTGQCGGEPDMVQL